MKRWLLSALLWVQHTVLCLIAFTWLSVVSFNTLASCALRTLWNWHIWKLEVERKCASTQQCLFSSMVNKFVKPGSKAKHDEHDDGESFVWTLQKCFQPKSVSDLNSLTLKTRLESGVLSVYGRRSQVIPYFLNGQCSAFNSKCLWRFVACFRSGWRC